MTVLTRRAGGGRTAGGQGVVRPPRPSKACRSCPGGPLFLPFHFEIIIDSHDKFQKQYREVLCPHYSAFPSGGISRSTRTLTEWTGAIQLTGFYLNLPQMSLYTCFTTAHSHRSDCLANCGPQERKSTECHPGHTSPVSPVVSTGSP